MWDYFVAFIFGVVEGITEWLPISSTGHMILVDEFIKLDEAVNKVIQERGLHDLSSKEKEALTNSQKAEV